MFRSSCLRPYGRRLRTPALAKSWKSDEGGACIAPLPPPPSPRPGFIGDDSRETNFVAQGTSLSSIGGICRVDWRASERGESKSSRFEGDSPDRGSKRDIGMQQEGNEAQQTDGNQRQTQIFTPMPLSFQLNIYTRPPQRELVKLRQTATETRRLSGPG